MKKLYSFIAFLLFCISGKLAAQQLVFEYDAAGNQALRQWVCVQLPKGNSFSANSRGKSTYYRKRKGIIE